MTNIDALRSVFDAVYDQTTDTLLKSPDPLNQAMGSFMASDAPKLMRHWIADKAGEGTDPNVVVHAICMIFAAEIASIIADTVPDHQHYHSIRVLTRALRKMITENIERQRAA
jgi:hypothetical protein